MVSVTMTLPTLKKVQTGPASLSSSVSPSRKQIATSGDLQGQSQSDLILARNFYRQFVANAFEERKSGNTVQFDELRRQFSIKITSSDAPPSNHLQALLVALTHQISSLDSSCAKLVRAILAMNWLGRDEMFVSVFVKFLGNLTSSHAEFSTLVIQMLVKNLTHVHSSVGRLPGMAIVTRDDIHCRVHRALAYILDLVPFAKESLTAVAVTEFPHKSEKVLSQTTFIQNLLRMTTYVPEIQGPILGVIIDKVISIDVEIQVDLEDLVDDDEYELLAQGADSPTDEEAHDDSAKNAKQVDEEVNSPIDSPSGENGEDFDHHDTEEESDPDQIEGVGELTFLDPETADIADSDLEPPPSMTLQTINENIRKLDSILTILFEFLTPIFNSHSFASHHTFLSLLHSLDNTILRTFRSRYTQFVLFWAAQQTLAFKDQFLGVILERALDHTRPSTHRIIAASYIGSFTARAKTLDRRMVRMLTGMMLQWVDAYLDDKEQDFVYTQSIGLKTSRDEVKKYGIFYAMMQALFYVFCFRWKELSGLEEYASDQDEGRWMPGLHEIFSRAMHSRLNPLKFCSSLIVGQFAKVANHIGFIYAFTLIEANKRTPQNGVGEIDSYFPFDPYRLTRSQKYVDEVYVEWSDIAPPGLVDQDEEEDDMMED